MKQTEGELRDTIVTLAAYLLKANENCDYYKRRCEELENKIAILETDQQESRACHCGKAGVANV